MQKICIVNKSKNKNILNNKNIKIKLGILMLILALTLPIFQNIVLASDEVENFGQYRICSYIDSHRYIKYQTRPQRIYEYYYINNNSQILPAYCMNLGADGAETVEGGYNVYASEYLNDNIVNNIILNGYPYKTVTELNVANESEARYATQFAVWIKLNNLDINQIEPMEEQYQRVVNAIKSIYYNGIDYNINYSNGINIKEVEKETDLDEIDNSCYSKTFELEYGDNILDIGLKITGLNDYILVDENNNRIDNIIGCKKIKLLFKRETNLEYTIFNIDINCKYKEHAVMFAKTLKDSMQNMSLTLQPIKENNSFFKSSLKTINTKLEITKQDAIDNSIYIPNVKFNILDKDDKLLGEYVTNNEGRIIIDVEKDLKIFNNELIKVKEVEVPDPYVIDEDNCLKEVKLKIGENTKISFKNNRKEEIPRIELPKTGF